MLTFTLFQFMPFHWNFTTNLFFKYMSWILGMHPWYNPETIYTNWRLCCAVFHKNLPCIKMPQHDLAEDVNHDFILKLINAQNVEMTDKPWGYLVSTLAHRTHGTHQLHNKTCFDHHIWKHVLASEMSKLFKMPGGTHLFICLFTYLSIYLHTYYLWTVWSTVLPTHSYKQKYALQF